MVRRKISKIAAVMAVALLFQGISAQTDNREILFQNRVEAVETQIIRESFLQNDEAETERSLDVDTTTDNALTTITFFDEITSEFNPRTRLVHPESRLQIFGQSFFNMANEVFNNPNVGPVNSHYRLGTGDEIIIQIWGEVRSRESLIVERNGTITPTGLGQVKVAGLTVAEAKAMLIRRFSAIHSGVRNGASNATTFVDVFPGTLRQKSVIVVGEVNRPGNYFIPSTAGVVAAIARAGGPTDRAGLRNVHIRRGGADRIDSLDLYDFFLTGRITDTITLADFDVILVNPVQKRVGIDGAVRRPGQYELKAGETFDDLFRFSGGLLSEAFTRNITIERTEAGVERRSMTINKEDFVNISPQNNDFILIDFIDKVNNTVSIEGVVERPGKWEFREGMKVSDLIELAGGVLDHFFGDRIEIFRTNPDFTKEVLSLNVRNLLDGTGSDLYLQKWDVVRVYSIWDLRRTHFVEIRGEVNIPGIYFLREGMTIQDAILLAGGFNNIAFRDTIEISRIVYSNPRTGSRAELERITVYEDFFKNNTHFLQHRDIIMVRQDMRQRRQELVHLSGEFVFPGYYTKLTPDETLLSLITRAGGFTASAYLEGARLNRSKDGVGNIAIDFDAVFNRNRTRENIILEDGDRIFVPTIPRTVAVSGAVYNPMNVTFSEGKPVRHYLKRAGGQTALGQRGTIFVVRANGETMQSRKSNRNVVNAGSQIVVNEGEPRRERSPSEVRNTIATVLSGAVSVLTIMLLIQNLD